MRTTAGALLLEAGLPAGVLPAGPVGKAGLAKLLSAIGKQHPGRYGELVGHIKDVGNQAAYESGTSFELDDLAPHVEMRDAIFAKHQSKLDALASEAGGDPTKTSSPDFIRRRMAVLAAIEDEVNQHVATEVAAAKNNVTKWVASGAKGDNSMARQMVAMSGLNVDAANRLVPDIAKRSFSEGLSPIDFLVHANGARKGVVLTYTAVQAPGAFAKELNAVASDMLITETDCGATAGRDLFSGSPDVLDRYLAHDVPGVGHRNDLVDQRLVATTRRVGVATLPVRSPLTCLSHDGVCARCFGPNENGVLPVLGEHVGLKSAQACLEGSTEIRMADGSIRRIDEIVIGDWVLGCDRHGFTRSVEVVNTFDNGFKEVYRTTFRQGTGKTVNIPSVNSTLDHKILAVVVKSHGKQRRPSPVVRMIARPENIHDRFYAKLPIGFDDDGLGHPDEIFALALGLVIGDGCYTGSVTSNGISLSCHDPSMVVELGPYFDTIGCRLVPQSTPGEYRITAHNGGKCPIGGFRGIRNPLRAILVSHDLWGQYSIDKTLPDVKAWSNNAVAEMIGGLIATDGCVYIATGGRVSVSFSSTSKALIESVRHLFMSRFGIYPSAPAAYAKKKSDGSHYAPSYQIYINGFDNVSRFAERIHVPGVKGPRLAVALAAWKPSLKSLEAGRCAVVSQERVGVRHVYDIMVDHPDHLFVLANGLVASNCTEPLTQLALNNKHAGGVVGAARSPLEQILQFMHAPKAMSGAATLAKTTGEVLSIHPAPAGGFHINVAGVKHYAPPDLAPLVKVGQQVTRGDALSGGTPHPIEVVEAKGMGPGRTYFADRLKGLYDEAGIRGHAKVFETIARSMVNLARVVEPGDTDHVPGEIVHWNQLPVEHQDPPVENIATNLSHGRLLALATGSAAPFTVITPKLATAMVAGGIKALPVFKQGVFVAAPVMMGTERAALQKGDWMANLAFRYLTPTFKENAATGATSDVSGWNPYSAYAHGATFGKGPGGRF